MGTSVWRTRVWRIVAAAGLVAACTGKSTVDRPGEQKAAEKTAPPASEADGDQETTDEPPEGLQFAVSEAEPNGDEVSPPQQVEGTPLDESEVEGLLNRVEPIAPEPDDQQSFSFRSRSKPAPTTGETEATPFPPPEQRERPSGAAAPEEGPLEIVRRSPAGEVGVAPRLSVTFSHPMVTIGSAGRVYDIDRPVELTPETEGTWRWVGTRTLLFEPERGRFPMASEFEVSVPEETESVDGVELEEAASWSFSTLPVRVERIHPTGGPHPRRPLMFMAFNQTVEPRAILEYVRVWGGGEMFRPHLVSEKRLEDNETVRRMADRAPEDQWIVFSVDRRLPADTKFQLGLEQGAPSAEGDRRSSEGQYETFETYSPLQIEQVSCLHETCRPLGPWIIEFNNPLDPESVDASTIQIDPELPDKKVGVDGNRLMIKGRSQGRQEYEVTLSGDIRDRYGQTLGSRERRTIQIGAVPAIVYGGGSERVTLDPTGPTSFPVHSVNYGALEVTVRKVAPSDWPAYLEARRARRHDREPSYPGETVVDETIEVEAEPDEFAKTRIELGEALEEGAGQVVLTVEGADSQVTEASPVGVGNERFEVWVQVTDIGLDAYIDGDRIVAWATSLAEGRPLEDVEVELTGTEQSATTDESGVAEMPLPEEADEGNTFRQLVARKGPDTAFVPESSSASFRSGRWRGEPESPTGRWFVFDDRNLYQPGESMRLKGWLRRVDDAELSIPDAGTEVDYAVRGPRGNEIASDTVETDAHGGFELGVELSDDVNLGSAEIDFEATVDGEALEFIHRFQIQEFRRPSFEVGLETDTPGPHVVGESVEATAEASYYAGGEVRGAEIMWKLDSRTTDYDPPGWSEFVFGDWQPWWFAGSGDGGRRESFEGRTGPSGRHRLAVDLEGVLPPDPQTLSLNASVTDINRQTISSSRELLVHPSEMYVGLKTERWFVEPDEPLEVDVVTTRIDGTAVPNRTVAVRAERLEWRQRDGEWVEEVAETTTCEVETAEDPVTCQLELGKRGQWRIASRIADEQGRPNRTRFNVWVPGGRRPTSEQLEREQVQLVPQKETWQPGETAEVLVQAPFAGGEGLAVVQRDGVEETIRFSMEGTSHRLEIPIAEEHIPNVHLRVDVNGSTARRTKDELDVEDPPDRPAFATGELELKVSRASKALSVDVEPASAEADPGGEVEIGVEVEGPNGEPVAGSQVALVAVDEAVLAAADYELGDPVETLHPTVGAGTSTYHTRESVLLASFNEIYSAIGDDSPMAESYDRSGAMAQAKQSMAMAPGGETIDLRKDFRPLALFAPALETDEQGRATATVELPDTLTRYRLMAVAVEGTDRSGAGESQLTARLPLMVQPSMPRFLNWGDRADLPVVVRNQTDEDRTVRMAARSSNLALTDGRGYRFDVPAGDRVELRFPSRTESTGRARLQFVADSGDWGDAAEVDFPVWTPATTQAFADYGVLDEGATRRRIEVPEEAVEEFGGLEVTTSSTALEQLTDAVLYLVEYPYDGAEQVASRVLSVAALRDVLGAFEAEGLPAEDKIEEMFQRDVERLTNLMQPGGGFGLWSRDDRPWPFVTIHAAHALVVADQNGAEVPDGVLNEADMYMSMLDDRLPDDWSDKLRNTVRAYSLYVRRLMGSPFPEQVEKLAGKSIGDELSLEAAGWLLSTLAMRSSGGDIEETLRNKILDRAVEEAGTAQFAADYADDEGHLVMHSERRADALVLDALIRSAPDNDLIPKVVEGLMAHRTKGRWSNTQENVFVLLALQRYFETFEDEAPDFVAEMWLGDQYVGEHAYRERTTDQKRVEIPTTKVREVDAETDEVGADLTIAREGSGRLYYRIGMSYVPESRELAPLERGFAVERTYEPVDGSDEVRRREDGTWAIEAGARVRVRLQMVAPARRHHVALVDPLAGGFESLNPAIATAEPIPDDPSDGPDAGSRWWWHRPWFEHQNLRDERTEAFASSLGAGVHEYTYVVRATTPGEFTVPPPKAEEMYHPETFGRGATDRVVVK